MQAADFSRLLTFVAVAERGSFVKAAAVLGVSTSSVSQTVRALEDTLGVRLFNRTTRSVALTEAGTRLRDRLLPLLSELDGAVDDMNDYRANPKGTLRLTVSSLALSLVIRPMLGGFLQAYPDITVELVVDDTVADLVDARMDAGLRPLNRIPRDMIAVRVTPECRILAVASPDYVARRGRPRSPADLAAHSCIQFRFDTGALYPWTFDIDGQSVEPAIGGPLITDSAALLLQSAIDGLGICYTLETHAAEALAAGLLVPLLESSAPTFPGWFLYYSSRRQMRTPLRLFMESLAGTVSASRAA